MIPIMNLLPPAARDALILASQAHTPGSDLRIAAIDYAAAVIRKQHPHLFQQERA